MIEKASLLERYARSTDACRAHRIERSRNRRGAIPRQTWQVLGLVGYRWPAWGGHFNLQAGYRAIRVFDFSKNGFYATEDVNGPNVIFGFDF